MTIKSLFIFFVILILASTLSFCQDTIWVREGNKREMYRAQGEWLFKSKLKDGYYRSHEGAKEFINIEVSFNNGKKEGIENRYFAHSRQKYAVVNWRDGKKNGVEVHYNANGTIAYKLAFKDDVLNGFSEVNWANGARNYTGFYKNGFRDSIWTYYFTGNSSAKDTSSNKIEKEYLFRDGQMFIKSSWNKNGVQMVCNGNGVDVDSSYGLATTNYFNGLKEGPDIFLLPGGMGASESEYRRGMLINERAYSNSKDCESISEWCYPQREQRDTCLRWIDPHITDIFFNDVKITNIPLKSGFWIEHYPNKAKVYEGNYKAGERIGEWRWYYPNSRLRIFADYTSGKWKHFDSLGNLVSIASGEFLTKITEGYWFLNQKLGSREIAFSKFNNKVVTPRYVFHFDGKLEINDFLECGKDISNSLNYYVLFSDILNINVSDPKAERRGVYTYKITSATDDKITLVRQSQTD